MQAISAAQHRRPLPAAADRLRLVAAPMAGISSAIYRRLCREQGATLTFTEMVSAGALARGNRRSCLLMRRDPDEEAAGAQVFGADPEEMARAAAAVEAAGFAVVDINMGCPVRKVIAGGAGAALMRDPLRAAAIVQAVREAVSIPVTVKIRAGWEKGSRDAVPFAVRLQEAGADAVTLHARSREEGYSAPADWSLIGEAVAALGIPVVGNGDVAGAESALRMLQRTGCAGVMVGRAALGRPWVFAEIASAMAREGLYRTSFLRGRRPDGPAPTAQPRPEERYLTVLRHYRGLVAEHGPVGALRKFRTHAAWYTRGCQGAAGARRIVTRARTARQVREALRALFGVPAMCERLLRRTDRPGCH